MNKEHGRKGVFGQSWHLTKTKKKSLERLINQKKPSELELLRFKALFFDEKTAKSAAKELLKRATEVQQYLGPVLWMRPHVLADEAERRFELPVSIALGRAHGCYYKRVLDQLRGLKLGSKTGIASDEQAYWTSKGEAGTWAVILHDVAELLRGNKPVGDNVFAAFVLTIRKEHPDIADDARTLDEFGEKTVEDWIKKVCSPVLYALNPSLQPAKRGKRKQSDRERTDPSVKRRREAIFQKIRDMVAMRDKSRSYKSRL